jgi:hypothetical protein
LGIGQLANLEKIGNLYNIVVILDREFHNGREAARIKDGEGWQELKREGKHRERGGDKNEGSRN